MAMTKDRPKVEPREFQLKVFNDHQEKENKGRKAEKKSLRRTAQKANPFYRVETVKNELAFCPKVVLLVVKQEGKVLN